MSPCKSLLLVVFSEDTVLYYNSTTFRVNNPLFLLYSHLSRLLGKVILSSPAIKSYGDFPNRSKLAVQLSARPYYGGSVMGFFKSLPRIALPTLRNIKTNVREADLVMVQLPSSIGFLVYLQAKRMRTRYFLYIVGDIRRVATQGEKYRNPLMRLAVAAVAHMFHMISQKMACGSLVFVTGSELLREFSPLAKRCVNLIPSVVSDEDIFIREDVCTTEPIRLLYVGRLVPVKGLKYLLQALKQLLDGGLPVELRLIGDGYQKPYLESLAEEMGITKQVSFLGRVPFGPELFRAYRESHIFVLPSLSEGIPKTLLEAMASGLPIVATRVGGIPDVVKDGETGLLVEPRSPEQIAQAVERLVSDPLLRRRLIRNGYHFAKEHTVEKQAELMWREICSFFKLEAR